jgi:hypothetical protein
MAEGVSKVMRPAEAPLVAHQLLGARLRLARQALVEQGRGETQRKNDEGGAGDDDRQQLGVEAVGQRIVGDAEREGGGEHAGEMHAGDGGAHHEGGAELHQQAFEAEAQPERHAGRGHRDHHRGDEQGPVIAEGGAHQHRLHAGVMHDDDADAGDQAGQQQPHGFQRAESDQRIAGTDRDDREQHRGRGPDEVIGDRDRHREGQHGDEMHRPDAAAQGDRRAAQPEQPGAAGGVADPPGEIQRGEGGEDGNHAGQSDQPRVVLPVEDQVGRRQWNSPGILDNQTGTLSLEALTSRHRSGL